MKTGVRCQVSGVRTAALIYLLGALIGLAGCHSFHIDMTVENRTGAPLRLLEVDYPFASFGVDSLDNGAIFHYRIQVQGSGDLKIQYMGPGERQVQIKGPALERYQEGTMGVVLLPNGKAQFQPHLSGPQASKSANP
jgi:hypothetical protein